MNWQQREQAEDGLKYFHAARYETDIYVDTDTDNLTKGTQDRRRRRRRPRAR